MIENAAATGWQTSAWTMVARLGEADGAAAHGHRLRLLQPNPAQRDLADAVHGLCAVHGRHPGMIDDALAHGVQPSAKGWLEDAAGGFAGERAYLARLTAAVGPMPSTPGQSESEAAFAAQRHALEMLARSDRAGCATGAVVALMIDWRAIRAVLDQAAKRFGSDVPIILLPQEDDLAATVTALALPPASERAILFGAQQVFAQHRGLWDLLEARAAARDRS